jgi:hypothetical protein
VNNAPAFPRKPEVKQAFHAREKIEPARVRFHRNPHTLIGTRIAACMNALEGMNKAEKWEAFLQEAAKHGVTITIVVAVVDDGKGDDGKVNGS